MVLAGKPSSLRGIAIGALGRVDLKNHDITARLISYLNESSFDIRFASIFALGHRGDPPQSSRSKRCSRPGNSPSASRTHWRA